MTHTQQLLNLNKKTLLSKGVISFFSTSQFFIGFTHTVKFFFKINYIPIINVLYIVLIVYSQFYRKVNQRVDCLFLGKLSLTNLIFCFLLLFKTILSSTFLSFNTCFFTFCYIIFTFKNMLTITFYNLFIYYNYKLLNFFSIFNIVFQTRTFVQNKLFIHIVKTFKYIFSTDIIKARSFMLKLIRGFSTY